MCGLIAGFNTNPKDTKKTKKINDFIIDQYEDQHGRGQKGFGIIRINPKGKVEIDRACEGTKFLLDLYLKESPMIIAHHRYPTSTENWLDQTHPMIVSNNLLKHDYYIIHNGVLTNDRQLREKHLKLGFVYTTEYQEEPYYNKGEPRIKFNDSEALAVEMALLIEGQSQLVETENQAALIALQVNKKTGLAERVFFGKNGAADLKLDKRKGTLKISSEGIGEEVPENILFSFGITDPKMKLTESPFPFMKRAPYVYERDKEKKEETKDTKDTKVTQLNLPINQTITEKDGLGEEDYARGTRCWVDLADPIEYPDIPLIDKNYVEIMTEDLKAKLKNCDCFEISSTIDDALDEQVTEIETILASFKAILLTDSLSEKDQSFFVGKIAKIMKAMRIMTDETDKIYQEVKIIEDQKEIDDYNIGFNTGYTKEDKKTEKWPGYNKSRDEYLSREF